MSHSTSSGVPPQPAYGSQAAKTETLAIVVLALAISSFVVVPLVGAIAALVLAPGARRKIEESAGRLTGESLVRAGIVISWINVALAALAFVAFVVLVAVGVSLYS